MTQIYNFTDLRNCEYPPLGNKGIFAGLANLSLTRVGKYAAMLFLVFCLGIGEMWGQTLIEADDFETESGTGSSFAVGGFKNSNLDAISRSTESRTGAYSLKTEVNSTSEKIAISVNQSIAVSSGSYLHTIAWTKLESTDETSASSSTQARIRNYVGGNGNGTAVNLTTSWQRITSAKNAGSNQSSCNVQLMRKHASKLAVLFDDVVIYVSTNSTTDITAPSAATSASATTSSIGWTCGSDANTGIANTLIWRRTSGSSDDLTLNNQGKYAADSIDQSGHWTCVSATVGASATSYAGTFSGGDRYAIVHRDLAYNYSTPTYVTVAGGGGGGATTYDVIVEYNGSGSYGTAAAADDELAEDATTTITATPATGYQVTNWAVSGTGASISPSGASNSNTTTLTMGTANATVTATFGPKSYTVTLNNQSATTAGTESMTTTYNANTNLTSAITCPTKTGYVFAGYFTATNGGGVQLIDAAGNWIASAGGGSTYLDGSKNWKNDGNLTLYACWMEYCPGMDMAAQAISLGSGEHKTWTGLTTNKILYSVAGNTTFDDSSDASNAYDGLKFKNSGDYILFLVQANSSLKLYFGYTDTKPKISINGGAESNVNVTSTQSKTPNQEVDFGTETYDRLIKLRTVTSNTVVLQKIEITAPAGCSAYEFHYGTHGEDDWETACFEQVGETNEWKIEDFTIPSTPNFYVGYYGDGTNGWNSTWSAEKAWTDAFSDGNGAMVLLPTSSSKVGLATGATGTLTIWSNSGDKNKFVGFKPDGYAIMYGGNNYAFSSTATDHMLETDVVTLPNVGSTTYQMGIKTASSYMTCAHSSSAENINAMGVTTEEGGLRKIWLYSTADSWIGSEAKMAIWDATNSHWGDNTDAHKFMTKVNDNLWYGYVPKSAETIILVRVNPSNDDPAWDWGKSYDITPGDLNNYVTITGTWSNSKAEYTIGSTHPATGEKGKFRMWDNSSSSNWYVHWIPYNVLTYDANGGSGTTAQTERNTESSTTTVSVASNGFTAPTGYSFNGWNTLAGGGGDSYAAGADYTLTANGTLYAQWSANTISVTLAKGEHGAANQAMTIKYDAGSYLTFTAVSANTGYTCSGYYDGETKVLNADGSFASSTVSGYITSSKWTKADNCTLTAKWTAKTYDVTLNDQDATTSVSPSKVTATYNSSTIDAITNPEKTGYTFGGWYKSEAGAGGLIISDAGALQNSTDYTDGSGNWTNDDDATVYAKWTQSVTIDENGGSADGSVDVTYKGTAGTPSVPTYAGHTADLGYYAESSCTNKVMALDGTLQTSVTDGSSDDWTNSSSKWVYAGAATLYAHWKCNTPEISCSSNTITISVPTGATVYYTTTTDGSDPADPTSSSTAYNPSSKPTISADTKIKAIAIQSGCTSSAIASEDLEYSESPLVTWQMNLNTATWGAAGTSTEDDTNITSIATSRTSGGTGNKDVATAKVKMASAEVTTSAAPSEYAAFTFTLDCSKTLEPEKITCQVFNVSAGSRTYKAQISDNNGHVYNSSNTVAVSTEATLTDATFTFASDLVLFGNITLRVYAWDTDAEKNPTDFRMGEYVKFYGEEDDAETFDVTWIVNGTEYTTGSPTTSTTECAGIVAMPTPADNTISGCANSFRGWSETNLYGEATNTQPTDLFASAADAPTIDENKTFYAVFGTATGASYVNTVLWSEDWTGQSDNAKPSSPTAGGGYAIAGATIGYAWAAGDGTSPGDSYVTTNGGGNLAGGLSPEAILGKKGGSGTTGGSLTVSGIPNKGAKKLTLKYKQNDKTLQVAVSGTGYSFDPSGTTKSSNAAGEKEYTIICGSAETFSLTFTATTTTAVRLDDIVVKIKEDGATNYRCICPSLTLEGPSGDIVFVTSAASKTVRSQEAFTVSGTGLTKSRTLTTGDFGSSKFAFKSATGGTVSTDENGDLAETEVYVFYTPDAEDDEDGLDVASKVTISVEGGGAATSNDLYGTKSVIGRHLPANFVIAAKNGDNWYALPAGMGQGDAAGTRAPVQITVDDDDDPTIASTSDANAYSLIDVPAAVHAKDSGDYVILWMHGKDKPLYGNRTTAPIGSSTKSVIANLDKDYWWALTQKNTSITNASDAKYNISVANGNTNNPLKIWLNAGGTGVPYWGIYSSASNIITEIRLIPVADPCFKFAAGTTKASSAPKFPVAVDGNITTSLWTAGNPVLTGGSITNTSSSSKTIDANENYGLVFDDSDKEIKVTLSGDNALAEGTIITLHCYSVNANSTTVGFKVNGNNMSPESYTTTAAAYQTFSQSYTIPAASTLIGKQSFKIKRYNSNKAYIRGITVTGCGERSGYTVTYADGDATSGSVPVDDNTYDEGDDVTVLDNDDLVKTGYTFGGWSDGVNEYEAGDTFDMPAEDVTLTAQWTPNTYTITYHLNGASWASSAGVASYTVGTGATLPLAGAMTNVGYTFDGWYANSDLSTGGVVTSISTSDYGNKEYWAKWTENTYTLSYDANGGTGTMADTTGHYVTIKKNGFTAPSGKIFAGWNTLSTGSGVSYNEGDEVELTAALKLYAIWAKAVGTINWTVTKIDSKLYRGGGGYTIKAEIDDASWDASAADSSKLELTASDGVVLRNIARSINASGKAQITAKFDITTDVIANAKKISFTLNVPKNNGYAPKNDDHNENLDNCTGGKVEVRFTSSNKNDEGDNFADMSEKSNTIQYVGDGLAKLIATGDCKISASAGKDGYRLDRCAVVFKFAGTTALDVYYTAGSSSRSFALYSFSSANDLEDITTSDYGTKSVVTSVTGVKAAFANTSATSSNPSISTGVVATSGSGGGIIATYSSLSAGYYVLLAVSGEGYLYGFDVSDGGSGGEPVSPTLTWTPALNTDGDWDSGNNRLNKETGDADFTFTVTQDVNSLGAITYASSNTDVATVNSTTGKVHIAGAAGNATITATMTESGCYEEATATYNIAVVDNCDDVPGTIETTDLGCSGTQMTVSGHTGEGAGATYQWYKDGASIGGATSATYTATAAGEYYVVVTNTGDGHCAMTSTNTIVVEALSGKQAKRLQTEWYVKNGRRTPDIALVQTGNAKKFIVKNGETVLWDSSDEDKRTGFGGCGFYLGDDEIIYLKGTQDDGSAPSGLTGSTDVTLTIKTVYCDDAEKDNSVTIHCQAATSYKEVAFVVDGTEGGNWNAVTSGHADGTALYEYLDTIGTAASARKFQLTERNIYKTVDDSVLREHYSQFDAILITDNPSTDKKSGKKSYVDAFGTMIDIRPILTMEAYVSKLSNWKAKGINGNPSSPNPRQYGMKLECKNHEIFAGLNESSSNIETDTVDGVTYWTVLMVDSTKSPYTGVAYNVDTKGDQKPALQGFSASDVSGLMLLGQISNGTLFAGVERQDEPAARLLLLGVNAKALPNALTPEGKRVIANALSYLCKTNMEDVDDCSTYFTGKAGTTDWGTAGNWSKGVVPNSPMLKVRILKPCVVPTSTKVRISHLDIVVGGKSKEIDGTPNGSLTIPASSAVVVAGIVNRVKAPYYGLDDLMPTETEDLKIEADEYHTGALIFNNEKGDTKATVEMYSKSYWEVDNVTGKKKKYWSYVGVPIQEVDIPNYFYLGFTYLYDETSGWTKKGDGSELHPFEGIGLSMQSGHKETFYGTLASTETREITLTKTAEGGNGENLIGNSWTAPIQIANFDATDFGEATATVYVYNTGRDAAVGGSYGGTGSTTPGQWVSVPVETAKDGAYDGLKVIPAMNAFQVNTESETTLTLDYNKLVRKGASTNDLNDPMRAPRRQAAGTELEAMMRVRVSGTKTHTDVWLQQDSRFTDAFDNGWEAKYAECDNRSAQLYAQSEIGNMAFLALPDLEGTILGFAPSRDGNEYTFTFHYAGEDEFYLNDLKLVRSALISEVGSYTFTYEEGDTNRFYISRTRIDAPQMPTGVENTHEGVVKAHKFIYNDKLYILFNGRVYSADGQMVK